MGYFSLSYQAFTVKGMIVELHWKDWGLYFDRNQELGPALTLGPLFFWWVGR